MVRIMARGIHSLHGRRCDHCRKNVKFIYRVNEGSTHGWFCGPNCLRVATENMKAIKKEKGIDDSQDDES